MLRFFALVATLAVALPARADTADTEAAVAELGGTATTDPTLDDNFQVSVKIPAATDSDLLRLAKLPDIGAIRIGDATRCTEAGLAVLRELPNLQQLMLGRCPLTPAEAAALGGLRTLTLLHVGDSMLTDAGLAAMKKLVNLTSLDLLDAPVTDRAAPVLAGFKKLEELSLAGTQVTDKGVVGLAPLVGLKQLKLHNTAVTRKGIDAIEKALPKLTVRW